MQSEVVAQDEQSTCSKRDNIYNNTIDSVIPHQIYNGIENMSDICVEHASNIPQFPCTNTISNVAAPATGIDFQSNALTNILSAQVANCTYMADTVDANAQRHQLDDDADLVHSLLNES